MSFVDGAKEAPLPRRQVRRRFLSRSVTHIILLLYTQYIDFATPLLSSLILVHVGAADVGDNTKTVVNADVLELFSQNLTNTESPAHNTYPFL